MCNGNVDIMKSYVQGLTTESKSCCRFLNYWPCEIFRCLGLSTAYERENDPNPEINRFDRNRITHSIDETSKAHLTRNDVE